MVLLLVELVVLVVVLQLLLAHHLPVVNMVVLALLVKVTRVDIVVGLQIT